MWNLSSLTRAQTCVPAVKGPSLKNWTTRKFAWSLKILACGYTCNLILIIQDFIFKFLVSFLKMKSMLKTFFHHFLWHFLPCLKWIHLASFWSNYWGDLEIFCGQCLVFVKFTNEWVNDYPCKGHALCSSSLLLLRCLPCLRAFFHLFNI